MMPPLVYETAAWLRHYTCLPIKALPGESEPAETRDLTRAAYAAPIAGALIGAAAGIVLLIAASLGAADFVAGALALFTLVLVTCGRTEQALAASAEKLGRAQKPEDATTAPKLLSYGLIAIVLAVLVRVGALDGLVAIGPWKAAFAVVGAAAVSRAATLAFMLLRPAPAQDEAEPAAGFDTVALQWLAAAGIGLGVVTVLPFLGIGATIAGLAAAIGAVALVSAFVPRADGGEQREFSGSAELVSEIAFLVAVLAFATRA